MRKFWIASSILILTAFLLAGCSTATSTTAPAAATSVPAAPAATVPPPAVSNPTVAAPAASTSAGSTSAVDVKALLEDRCTRCHSLNRVVNHKGTADEWTRVVDSMMKRGAVLSTDEKTALIQYLAETYK